MPASSETLAELSAQMCSIYEGAEAEGRDLNEEESEQFDALFQKYKTIEAASRVEITRRIAEPQPVYDGPHSAGGHRRPERGRVMFKNAASGEDIRGFTGREPISETPDLPVGDVVKAMMLNDIGSLPTSIQNSLSTGSDSGGGYLLAPALSTAFIDLARSASVVTRAGATTIPLTTSELAIARLDSDPTGYWRPETGAITASKPSFGRYVLRPKVIATLVPVSVELLEDSANAGQAIEMAIQGALGQALDRAALKGAGAAAEPLGVVNHSGVNTITGVGTPTTYANVSAAVGDVLASNYDGDIGNLSWILPPVLGETYDNLVTGISSDNTPLQPTPWVSMLQRYYTTNMTLTTTNSPNDHEMIVGDFSQMVLGMRSGGVRIEVLDQGTATDADSVSWNATTQLLRYVRAYMRVDVALLRPTWFTVLSGVTN